MSAKRQVIRSNARRIPIAFGPEYHVPPDYLLALCRAQHALRKALPLFRVNAPSREVAEIRAALEMVNGVVLR